MNRISVNLHSNGDYWQAYWTDDLGEPHKRGLGSKEKHSRTQARKLAQRLEADLNDNQRLARGERAPLLGEFLDDYLVLRTDVAPTTHRLLTQTADTLRQHFGGDTPIDRITKPGASGWRTALAAATYSPRDAVAENTVRKHLRNAHTIFQHAVDLDILTANAFALKRRGTKATRREWFDVTNEIAAQLIAGCTCTRRRLSVGLWRYAGLRQHEAFNLAGRHYDRENKLLTVYDNKRHKRRRVPVEPYLEPLILAVLDEAPDDDAPLLEGISPDAKNLERWYKRLCKRIGLDTWPEWCQVMRRARASELASRNIPINSAAEWMGHTIQVMQQYYLKTPIEVIERITRPQNRPQTELTRSGEPRKSLSNQVTGLGLEQPPKTPGKTAFPNPGDAESDASRSPPTATAAELAAVVTHWPSLSRPVQKAIVVLINAEVDITPYLGPG